MKLGIWSIPDGGNDYIKPSCWMARVGSSLPVASVMNEDPWIPSEYLSYGLA